MKSRDAAKLIPLIAMRQSLPLLLIVEDDSKIRVLYKALLKEHFRIAEAQDGEGGLLKAKELHPDAILTDHRMPHCTGAEMVARLREIPALSKTPIIVCSGCLDPVSERRFAEKGAYLLDKPVRISELMAAIEKMSTRVAGHAPACQALLPAKRKKEHPGTPTSSSAGP